MILDTTASAPAPKIAATTLKSNIPTSPQTIAPIMTRTNAVTVVTFIFSPFYVSLSSAALFMRRAALFPAVFREKPQGRDFKFFIFLFLFFFKTFNPPFTAIYKTQYVNRDIKAAPLKIFKRRGGLCVCFCRFNLLFIEFRFKLIEFVPQFGGYSLS